jgi:hypothetical protein
MSWDSGWSVLEETSEDFDLLRLTNNLAFVHLVGIEGYGGNGQVAATMAANGMQSSNSVSNFSIIDQGGDASRYYVVATYTATFDDGTSLELTDYIEARTITPGVSVVIFDGYGPSLFYTLVRPMFDTMLGTLTIPGAAASGGASTGEPEIELAKGEEGPAYMAGPWRVAIVAAAQGPDVPGVGLDEKDGKEWVVVVADVTNWGSSDPAFPAEDFFIQMVEADTQHKVASGSSKSVARELDLTDLAEIEIEYGETGRLVMVFSVNAGRTEPSLVYRNELFPLDEILISDFEAGDLSEPAGPPDLQEATLVSVSTDGETLRVQYEGESKSHRITLLGIDATESVDAVVDYLSQYEDETVYIETDPAIDESSTPAVYLWIDNERGDRVMLNQMLLEEGAAAYNELPQDARFGLWLQLTADAAAGTN